MSGAGSNLSALLEAATAADAPFEVVLVLSNHPGARALGIAAARGVAAEAMPVTRFGGDVVTRDVAMRDRLCAAGVELVVCAGYDRLLSAPLLERFHGAILNLHPSLLPAFAGGMHAVADALAAGVKVSGATVHLLEPGATDGGAIILQEAVPVSDDDDEASLHQRIHEAEWRILPRAVALWSQGRLRLEARRVRIVAPGEAGGAPPAAWEERP